MENRLPVAAQPSFQMKAAEHALAPRRGRRFLAFVTMFSLTTLLSGCGYAVGPAYDGEVQSVYVETFESDLYRRGLEFQLTEAVQRQIQTQSPLRLAKEGNADTKLSGRIVGAKKRSLGQTGFDDARQLEADIRLEIIWEDLRTGELLERQEVALAPDVINLKTEGSFAPEVGQSLATAYQIALEKMAREVVQMMEPPW